LTHSTPQGHGHESNRQSCWRELTLPNATSMSRSANHRKLASRTLVKVDPAPDGEQLEAIRDNAEHFSQALQPSNGELLVVLREAACLEMSLLHTLSRLTFGPFQGERRVVKDGIHPVTKYWGSLEIFETVHYFAERRP